MRVQISTFALAAMLAGSAQAADIHGGLETPGADYAPERFSWTGFYIGGRIGYGNANHDLTVQRYNGGYCYDPKGKGTDTPEEFDPTAPGSGIEKLTLFPPSVNFFGVAGNISESGCLAGETPGLDDTFQVDPSSRDIANLDGLNSHGIIGGVQLGADKQLGRFVIGVFGSYDLSSMETTGDIGSIYNPDGVGFDVTGIEKGDEWSIGARAGLLLHPRTLVYILAAYTQTDYDFKGTDGDGDAFTKTTTFDGVSVGGGIEHAVTQNIFVGLEYVHTFYGEETVLDTGGTEVGGFGQRVVDSLDEDKVMLTIKAKLNGGLLD